MVTTACQNIAYIGQRGARKLGLDEFINHMYNTMNQSSMEAECSRSARKGIESHEAPTELWAVMQVLLFC